MLHPDRSMIVKPAWLIVLLLILLLSGSCNAPPTTAPDNDGPPDVTAAGDASRGACGVGEQRHLLVQDRDLGMVSLGDLKVVSKLQPSEQQLRDLLFAWKVAKFVKSNAIVYAKDGQTIGVGAGQMSRVNSARIAGIKAEHAGLEVKGAVMASDAFFPFADGLLAAAEAGATAVIQPGGSMRDEEVIAAADKAGAAMVFERDDDAAEWRQSTELQASDRQESDEFGFAVAVEVAFAIKGGQFNHADRHGAVTQRQFGTGQRLDLFADRMGLAGQCGFVDLEIAALQ